MSDDVATDGFFPHSSAGLGELEMDDVLLYYDGPLLFTAHNGAGDLLIATALAADPGCMRYLYVPMSKARLRDLPGAFRLEPNEQPPNIVLACFNCNHTKADRFIKPVPRKPRVADGCYPNRKSRRPRKAFASEQLAEVMCRAVAEQYGRELVPYRCGRCPAWHVSPPRSAAVTKVAA